MINSQKMPMPLLKGNLEASKIQSFNAQIVDGNVVVRLNINGNERAGGEFSYPVYQDEVVLVGSVSSKSLTALDDRVIIRIELFTNEIDKSLIKDGKFMVAVSSETRTLFQSGKTGKGDQITKKIGTCYSELAEQFREIAAEKNKAEYRDPNLPYSIF